jgi:dihydrofolate reductase
MARDIVLMLSLSIDGYFEGPDGDLEWSMVDEELHSHFNEFVDSVDTIISGRRTHELMVDYWPTADRPPEDRPTVLEYARIWRDKPKLVYSRTLAPGPAPWNAVVKNEVDPDEIRALKARPGPDLVIGGAILAASFLEHGLIDQFRFYINPVVLGAGRRPLPDSDSRYGLRLIDTRTFGNGVVLLHYRK